MEGATKPGSGGPEPSMRERHDPAEDGERAGGGVGLLDRVDDSDSSSETDIASPESTLATPESSVDSDPLRVVLTGLDQNVDAFAREAAHEELSKKIEGPFWKRIATSAWQNLTREYQVVKHTNEKRQEILENENLLHHHGKSDARWREEVMDRYGSEYAEQMIHEGETFHKLNEAEAQTNPNAERIRSDIQNLMRKVARGEVSDDASLKMMEDRMAEAWRDEHISQDFIGEGQVLALNVGRKARELEAMINSAAGLSAVEREALLESELAKLEVAAGEARVGSRVEIDSTISERVAEKLRKVPFLNEGRLSRVTAVVGNELFVAGVVSVGAYAARRAVNSASKAVLLPGLGAGVMAGIRERRALRDERALEARRMDAGYEQDPTNKARTEIDETLYEAKPANELIDEIGSMYADTGELKIVDRGDLEAALRLQADISARIEISDRTGSRLISFTDVEELSSGRPFDLDLALVKFKIDLEKAMKDPTLLSTAGLTAEETYQSLSDEYKSIAAGEIDGEMTAKDRLFGKLVAKRVLKRVVATTMLGAAVSLGVNGAVDGAQATVSAAQSATDAVTNELFGFESDFDLASQQTDTPGQVGSDLPESVGIDLPEQVGTDLPESVGADLPEQVGVDAPEAVGVDLPEQVGVDLPDQVGTEIPDLPESVGTSEGVALGESTVISETAKVTLPEGFAVDVEGEAVTLTTPDGQTIDGMTLDTDGSLSQASQDMIQDKGFQIIDHQETIQGEPIVTEHTVKASEFVQNHQDEMKKINITKWFDNNSSRFDLNELGLQNKMDANGDITISVSGMTEGGSFTGNSGVNWHEAAKEGHMKVYLSASEGTQAQAFELEIKPDGTAVVDKDSAAHSLFNEQGKFIGGYQQAALNGGESGGSENIAVLATVVGTNAQTLTDTITEPTLQTAHHYAIYQQPETMAASTVIPVQEETIPVPTLSARRNLGQAAKATAPPVSPTPMAALPSAPSTSSAPGGSLGASPSPPPSSGPSPEPSLPSAGPEFGSSSRPGPRERATDSSDTASAAPAPEAASTDTGETGPTTADTSEPASPAAETTTGPEATTTPPEEPTANTNTSEPNPADMGGTAEGGGPFYDEPRSTAPPDSSTADDTSSAANDDSTNNTSGPQPQTNSEAAERKYFADLDAENLATPPGYDFAGYTGRGLRERKQATRFLDQAMTELGNSDKVAVVTRAQQLAQEALNGASGNLGALYTESLDILNQSAERVARDAAKDHGGEALLNDLDAETRKFPYIKGLDSYGAKAQKLASRTLWEASDNLLTERGFTNISEVGAGKPREGESDDQYRARDRAVKADWQKAVIKRARRRVHPDQYESLSDDQKKLFLEAQQILNVSASSTLFY